MASDSSVDQRFSSRLGLLLSTLGIAVGTGNIWRFPRIAAQNGGVDGAGALLIAWVIFLFAWSIPLIIAEYFLGRRFRLGVIGAFTGGMGNRFAWMGAFVAFVATAISFFYAVIIGWAIYFFVYMLTHSLPSDTVSSAQIWTHFQDSPWPYILHFLAVAVGALAILRGIRSIEKVNKILIPVLIVIILVAVIRSLLLPGAAGGIAYLFHPQWDQLSHPSVWLQALTQNAWDTGAGWGLFLTYAAYMKAEHGTIKNAFITGIGNNTISLLMAIMIFGTVFSVLQNGMGYSDRQVLEVMKTSGPASTGLTFIWMPQLFARMSFGRPLAILFFLGLTFAGFSSLISMFEMSARVLVDRGVKRSKAVWIIVGIVYLLGIPSAMNLNFLSNQDFVWGIGLMISGAFIAINVVRYGVRKLRDEMQTARFDWKAGRWWDLIMIWLVPAGAVVLLIWWFTLSVTRLAPDSWFNPFSTFSIMTCLVQWLAVTLVFVLLNHWLARRGKVSDQAG